MGTKDYEYMLVQKSEPYKKAIIQCKNNSCISEDNWKKFEEGEYDDKIVYILTIKEDPHTKENIQNALKQKYLNGVIREEF